MFKHYRFRPYPVGTPQIPILVRSAGHYCLDKSFVEASKSRWFYELFWTIKGSLAFRFGDDRIITREGDVFFYYPGESHHTEVLQDGTEYRWLTLDGSDTSDWLEAMRLASRRAACVGPCPVERFEEIDNALSDATPSGERRASVAAYAILLAASQAAPLSPAEGASLSKWTKERFDLGFTNPRLSVESLTAERKVHRSTLYRAFRSAYGLSPKQYLRNLRVMRGLALLKQSEYSIAETAFKSGFLDPAYFSRVVRAAIGSSPREFRQQFSSGS